MMSLTRASNVNENEGLQTPSKKRSEEGEKEKKPKKQKVRKEAVENINASNDPTEEIVEEAPESPIFIPTLSSPEPETPESYTDTPIQSHANIDLVA